MNQRVEQILVTIARQHAPQALEQWDRSGSMNERTSRLARLLANYNILVIMGDFPQTLQSAAQDVARQIQAWVDGYGQFYLRLATALFPSFKQISAHYTDDRWPVVIYVKGAATPVIQVMAGYVSPYIVERQFEKLVSEVELIGLMELLLEELEAASLPRDDYKKLLSEGAVLLKQMLTMPIRQLSLTRFDRPIFSDSQRLRTLPTEPTSVPEEDSALLLLDKEKTLPGAQPHPPYTRPDTETLMPTQVMNRPPGSLPTLSNNKPGPNPGGIFGAALPVLKRSRQARRRPPLPPLPRSDNSDNKK